METTKRAYARPAIVRTYELGSGPVCRCGLVRSERDPVVRFGVKGSAPTRAIACCVECGELYERAPQ